MPSATSAALAAVLLLSTLVPGARAQNLVTLLGTRCDVSSDTDHNPALDQVLALEANAGSLAQVRAIKIAGLTKVKTVGDLEYLTRRTYPYYSDAYAQMVSTFILENIGSVTVKKGDLPALAKLEYRVTSVDGAMAVKRAALGAVCSNEDLAYLVKPNSPQITVEHRAATDKFAVEAARAFVQKNR